MALLLPPGNETTTWIIHKTGMKPTPLQELHPLLFPPVLNRIFGHLSFWHQKKCRSVCKTWEAELRPFLRLSCKVNLSKLATLISDEDKGRAQNNTDAENQDCTLIPLSLPRICKICTSFIIEGEDPPLLIRVLIHLGLLPALPQIKYLEIKSFTWSLTHVTKLVRELPLLEELRLPVMMSSSENLSSPISTPHRHQHTNKYISKSACITKNWKRERDYFLLGDAEDKEEFVKLKRIIVTLSVRDLESFESASLQVEPLLKLVHLTPNLEEIYYPNIVQFTSPVHNPARLLLESIISRDTPFSKLAVLKIDTFLTNTDLRILTAKRVPFKSLQLTVTPEIGCTNLYDFLKCCENTLKSVVLTFRDGFRLTSKFPLLSRLDTMALILWKGRLDFVQDIGKLKILIVVLMEMDEEDGFLEGLKDFGQISQIEELEIHANQEGKVEMVTSLVDMMPRNSLRKLTLDWVNDFLLGSIYSSLPNLEELAILYGGFTERGIIPRPPLISMKEDDELFCDKEISIRKRRRDITDLKNLKSLLLTGDLTDELICRGVCQCVNLQRLELVARSSSKVTDTSIKTISDGRTLEFLGLKNFLQFSSPEMVDYLRGRFNGREVHIS